MAHLTAKEAAQALGITLPTLYAYTSRGLLRSEPVPGRPHEHRYDRECVERLRERKESRRDPAKAAARGLHWGSPVLSSGITLIHEGRLYYRGHDAVKLASTASLEQAAELFWEGPVELPPCPLSPRQLAQIRGCSKDPVTLIQAALPLAGAADHSAHDLRPAALRLTGARILRLLTAIVAGRDSREPVHRALQVAWAPRSPGAGEAIRTALVLCADHELNVSAFTARCAASAGAAPYDAISAAIAAVKGFRHGGETTRVAALLDEAGSPRRARAVVARRLRLGERLSGFGHPLYPAGDPRAALLMRLSDDRLARAVCAAVAESLQERPNVDFGLVALARSHGLPEQAPLLVFAVGRLVGWIAHLMEQYRSEELIRPRAQYTGPGPMAE